LCPTFLHLPHWSFTRISSHISLLASANTFSKASSGFPWASLFLNKNVYLAFWLFMVIITTLKFVVSFLKCLLCARVKLGILVYIAYLSLTIFPWEREREREIYSFHPNASFLPESRLIFIILQVAHSSRGLLWPPFYIGTSYSFLLQHPVVSFHNRH
jgi:hypothetical protein